MPSKKARSRLDQHHKRYIAEEVSRHVVVAADQKHQMRLIAKFMIDNLLWCWSADGIDERGVATRDLLKYSFDHLRHTKSAWEQRDTAKLRHEHAVPRREILRLLLDRRPTPTETLEFLERVCFGVILTLDQDAAIYKKDKRLRHAMPQPLVWDARGDEILLGRYAPFIAELTGPRRAAAIRRA